MTNPMEIKVQTTESGVRLKFTIKRNGAAMNLEGGTVKLYVEGYDPVTLTIIEAAAGRADYIVQEGDWDAGLFGAQIEVAYTGGTKFRSQVIDLKVEGSIAAPPP